MTEPTAPAIGTAVATVDAGVDARTGVPKRPWSVWGALVANYLAVATVIAGLLWAFWHSVDREKFASAAWLNGVAETEPGSLPRVLMVTGLFAIAVLVSAGAIIAGYYGWAGYRWPKWAGVIASGLSLLTLMINPVAAAGIAGVVVGAALLWLPGSRAFADRWHLRRHPTAPEPVLVDEVFYGPLPRYREENRGHQSPVA